ncbi:MAG: response regulator [Eubacterium sp.]|nr:response regulator [Eubacterium sp.]
MAKWIMVVDDDTANLKVAGSILSKNNMRVTALKSGKALINYISENGAPDLILLDIMMPEMDGFETLEKLRELEKEKELNETPVIFLTADEKSGTETKGFEVGVSDFVRKPFNPDVLLRRIDNVISMQSEMKSLKSEATLDKLTGFLNKAATSTALSKMCVEKSGCLMMIDLDSFKLVNDIYGHEMGDKVLISFANIIRETVPQGSKYGRIGGDEFVSFCRGVEDEEAVEDITRQLNEKLLKSAKEMMGEDMNIPLGTSVGAIMVPKHGNDYNSLLKLADKCLYIVKKNGKHSCSVYSSDLFDTEDESDVQDINTLSEIMGERNIPNVAMQLDMEAFSYVFRYTTRYFLRNNINSCKVLFTLEQAEGADAECYKNCCDEFGNHIRESLRKSDLLTRSRYNQYYILLTDIREEFVTRVINNVIDDWNESYNSLSETKLDKSAVVINYDFKFVRNDNGISPVNATADVALVEATEPDRTFIANILSKFGITVHSFDNCGAFFDYARTIEKVPELILLDFNMPDMNGFDVLEKLKEVGDDISRVPVVLLSDGLSDEVEVKALSKGVMDFIKKPYKEEVLKARVNHVLELTSLRKRYRRPKSLEDEE